MRIAVVTETFAPDINGVARTLGMFVQGALALQHPVLLIRPRNGGTADDHPLVDEVLLPGAPLPGYPGLRIGLPAVRRLRKALEQYQPDVVYVATEGPLGWAAMRVVNRLKIPVVSGFHTRFDMYSEHYGYAFALNWVRKMLVRFHNRAAATLVPTAQMQAQLFEMGVKNPQVLERAVATDQFSAEYYDEELRRSWGVHTDETVMMCVGRVAAEKNLQLLIRAYREQKDLKPDMKLVIVGDGPLLESLQSDNPDVIFTGMLKGKRLASAYASADLFVFPSLSETFGNVVLESLASGVPVVAYNYGAAKQFVRAGVNGYLAPCNQESAFIDAVGEGLSNTELHDRQIVSGSVEHLSPQAVAESFVRILAQAKHWTRVAA